jgi:hypothetical protein
MPADIKAATSSINVSAMNIGAATAGTTGQAFLISQLNNNGNVTWQIIPTGVVMSVTANLVGSIDGVNFFVLDTLTQSDTVGNADGNYWTGWNSAASGGVAAGELRFVVDQRVNYLRIDVVTVNGGGTVTGTFSVFEADR